MSQQFEARRAGYGAALHRTEETRRLAAAALAAIRADARTRVALADE